MGNTAKQCRLGLFQDSDFAGDLQDSKSTSGGTLCIFGSHTFVPISWMCKKQNAVSHSSTESEIISLDTGLRLDGLPALELWDLIVSDLGNVSRVSDGSGKPDNDVHKRHKSQKKIDVVKDIDSVPSNVQSSRQEALLYLFEDNEAVIEMIIKGRSPTMRHVSRIHRVALDWLFDRTNLDSKIQIKYIDTKKQLADILTKGNFTRDEWNHLLSLFSISHFSSTVCSAAMAKRIQPESGEERVTAKSRPMMNLIARTPSVVSSSTSVSPVQRYYGKQDPWKFIVADDRSGQPDELSSTDYSKLDYDRAWSPQEWKSEVTAHDRSGQPDKTSWDMMQQVAPHREEPLLDGNAQSVRYKGRLHDGSWQPDSANSQEVADSEIFVMGSDAAEFANKVKDQVRKRQKRMSNVADSGVPTGTVLDPSTGPKYLPCSHRESKGPNDGWMAAKASTTLAHRIVPRGEQHAFPHLLSYAVLPSRPTENRRCMLVAHDTSHLDRSWSAGTSTPKADSTASLIDLTCPLTTFTEFSAGPLDCGSPSADVSCTTSPVQANFTALSNARMEGLIVARNTTLWFPKVSKSFSIIFTPFSRLGKSTPFAGIK